MALLLQLRTKTKLNKTFTNPTLSHFFSTSGSNSKDDEPESTEDKDDSVSTNPNSQFSYFSDVKKVLKQEQSNSSPFTPRNPSNSSFTAFGSPAQTKAASLEEIRKNLSQFRRRYAEPDSPPQPPQSNSNSVSLHEIYRRNMVRKPGEAAPGGDPKAGKLGGGISFEAIRESVKNMSQNVRNVNQNVRNVNQNNVEGGGLSPSLSALAESLRKGQSRSPESGVIGGTGALPSSIFGKEMREKEGRMKSGDGDDDEMRLELLKTYRHEELGEKLRKLRPQVKGGGGDWFSLRELNDRLVKLRDMEEKENEELASKNPSPFNHGHLRGILMEVKASENKGRATTLQRLDIMAALGRTPSFMLQPPKEHLVEKYFHPDNMSSEEKLKIELARIRDEFKMSESDCGSFRVQVAQLTTKIKHLSSVLHKKDKHSRKGLIAMVQRRKRLLKYLRRTDWDSYCFVISKLGLRDNPDTKF